MIEKLFVVDIFITFIKYIQACGNKKMSNDTHVNEFINI